MEPKYKVRVERSVRIPMRDGSSLSADLIASRVILPVVPMAKLAPPGFLPAPQLHQVVKMLAGPESQQVVSDQITAMISVPRARFGVPKVLFMLSSI